MDNAQTTADELQALLLGGLEGTSVVGFGRDPWELGQFILPALGGRGWFLGVHVDPEAVRAAARRAQAGETERGDVAVAFAAVQSDLRLGRDAADALVAQLAPATLAAHQELERELDRLRRERPLVPDESVELVFATDLADLPSPAARAELLRDCHRVLRRGGRLVALDVVADEALSPEQLQAARSADGELGLSSLREPDWLAALAAAGLYGARLVRRDARAWKMVDGVELRRVAAVAWKGKEGPCWEHNQAVIYRGPFRSVDDDDGHTYVRGLPTAVCRKTFDILSREPYRGQFELCEPLEALAPEEVRPFPCDLPSAERDPRLLKRRRRPAAAAPGTQPGARDGRSAAPRPERRKAVEVYARELPPGGQDLVRAAAQRFAETFDVRVVDPGSAEGEAMPSQLRFRLSLGGDECLPAVVFDRVVLALGRLPPLEELEELVKAGRPFGGLAIATVGRRGD